MRDGSLHSAYSRVLSVGRGIRHQWFSKRKKKKIKEEQDLSVCFQDGVHGLAGHKATSNRVIFAWFGMVDIMNISALDSGLLDYFPDYQT